MLTLYHGDTSVCSSKVRVALAEKELPYESRLLNMRDGEHQRPDYIKLNPMAVVPTLVDDVGPIVESSIIIEYVNDLSSARPLMPANPHNAALARRWVLRGFEIHAAVNSLTFGTSGRIRELQKTVEEREAAYARMTHPGMATKRRDLVDNGVASPHVDQAIAVFGIVFGDMEADLERNGDWLMGDYSLADVSLIAYVDRLERLGLDGFWAGRYPRVAKWLAASTARPSYQTAIESYHGSHANGLLRREVGREAWPVIARKLATGFAS